MRILIIGSGGREHALAWKLKQRPDVEELYVAPGNGGTAAIAVNVPIRDDDIPGLLAFAREKRIDLVVPGPELPLTLGVVDAMTEAGIPCFGPSAACARLEGSKAFAKEVMRAAGVPTAAAGVFTDRASAEAFASEHGAPLVVKADGLAAGKGVIVAMTDAEVRQALDLMFEGNAFGKAGTTVVIEEFLRGEEVSLLSFCDGKTALPLPSAQDHKAVFDGDKGPNTGGMGAYSPAPVVPDSRLEALADVVTRPILAEMARRGTPFKGILYAGLMMTEDGPKVLEYNVRFGDPECQPLLMRLKNDLADIMLACIEGRLDDISLNIETRSALGVVLTARGYPGSYPKGMPISGIADAEALDGVQVFQAGTKAEAGRILANGGRVLCVTALGDDLREAQARAYAGMSRLSMENSQIRRDIGLKGLKRLGLA
ncbi:phosphoribosylamine--glycine ligase [uncultured Mailhella sp.]|uniref:phosphoribosylamine--glycine ligase n=1 Tax=uncultured Mailhella sp. TaxID=1981031 RepID=UPI0026334F54|nr:phosphoribosylamine--glycine ligase [uncultured Mailhella sp.]